MIYFHQSSLPIIVYIGLYRYICLIYICAYSPHKMDYRHGLLEDTVESRNFINNQTHKTCMAVVKLNGLILRYVAPHLRTPELCIAAVRQNGLALEHANVTKDIQLMRPEICEIAVRQNGMALKFVDPRLLTPEICALASAQIKSMSISVKSS